MGGRRDQVDNTEVSTAVCALRAKPYDPFRASSSVSTFAIFGSVISERPQTAQKTISSTFS
jgi:hypothetical protein